MKRRAVPTCTHDWRRQWRQLPCYKCVEEAKFQARQAEFKAAVADAPAPVLRLVRGMLLEIAANLRERGRQPDTCYSTEASVAKDEAYNDAIDAVVNAIEIEVGKLALGGLR